MLYTQIVEEVVLRLNELKIPYTKNDGTDITISNELLDAKWSTGKKKITYKAYIYCDEETKTVYMWELTSELGSGISFGNSSENTFQLGSTLYRKVKSMQYGLDGKAYEYDIDIGAIAKTVKEVTKVAGWKFKTVLKKEKAMYPGGRTTRTDI